MIAIHKLIPERIVHLRPATRSDAGKVAGWVQCGRAEGVFRPGNTPDAKSVACYQQRVRRTQGDYTCLVILDGDREIGYCDYSVRGRSAELLGIFIESESRGKGSGRHLLRYFAALARERQCTEIWAEIYADNNASLRAFHAAGFVRDPSRDRVEISGHILAYARPLYPFLHINSPDPAYRSLCGPNYWPSHVAIAEVLVDEIRQYPGIEVVLGLGSLGRGFGDEWSDIDLAVLGRGHDLDRIRRGEHWIGKLTVDVFPVDLEASPPSHWDDSRRQGFEESIVLFARNRATVGRIARAIRLRTNEQTGRARELVIRLGWLSFGPRPWFLKQVLGYSWLLPPDLWLQRGCVPAAHATADQALDTAIQLLFIANKRHVPDPKWRRFLVTSVAWLPADFGRLLEASESVPRTREGFHLRADAVLSIIEAAVEYLQKTRVLHGNLYRRYLATAPYYDPRA